MDAKKLAAHYGQSLGINANPDLRDHLADLATKGKATAKDLSAIPILAGELSEREEAAIRKTLDKLEISNPPAELAAFLAQGHEARASYVAALNSMGASNHKSTMIGMIASGTAAVVGIGVGLLTGQPDVAIASPFAASFGATLAAVFGYSRAGVIDEQIRSYGVHD